MELPAAEGGRASPRARRFLPAHWGWTRSFPTGLGKEYLVKAVQVLACEVLYYLVINPFPRLI